MLAWIVLGVVVVLLAVAGFALVQFWASFGSGLVQF